MDSFQLYFLCWQDLSAKFLHKFQPEKLAAYEWHFDTSSHAKLLLFGVLDEKTQQVKGAIELPGLLSFLADNSVKTKVQGLNDFPKSLHPPMIVHYFFDLMVTMGILCFVISGVYVLTLMFKSLESFLLIMDALRNIINRTSFNASYRIWMVLNRDG